MDYTALLAHLGIDLVALVVVGGILYTRRHGRRDRLFVFAIFNVGVFSVLAVISRVHVTAGVGFGLFALLSIIRLRSEPFANVELGYFFIALVLAVINGVSHVELPLLAIVDALVVLAVFVFDHERIQAPVLRRNVTLDAVHTDAEALRDELAARFGVTIVDLRITDVDYVRETTSVVIRFVDGRGRRARADELGDLEAAAE